MGQSSYLSHFWLWEMHWLLLHLNSPFGHSKKQKIWCKLKWIIDGKGDSIEDRHSLKMRKKFGRSIIKQSVRRRPSFLISDLIIRWNIPLDDLWPFWARADLDDATKIAHRINQTDNDKPTGFMLTLNRRQVKEKMNRTPEMLADTHGKMVHAKNQKRHARRDPVFLFRKENKKNLGGVDDYELISIVEMLKHYTPPLVRWTGHWTARLHDRYNNNSRQSRRTRTRTG